MNLKQRIHLNILTQNFGEVEMTLFNIPVPNPSVATVLEPNPFIGGPILSADISEYPIFKSPNMCIGIGFKNPLSVVL